MWLCILTGRWFEETFENAQWRNFLLCILTGRRFEEAVSVFSFPYFIVCCTRIDNTDAQVQLKSIHSNTTTKAFGSKAKKCSSRTLTLKKYQKTFCHKEKYNIITPSFETLPAKFHKSKMQKKNWLQVKKQQQMMMRNEGLKFEQRGQRNKKWSYESQKGNTSKKSKTRTRQNGEKLEGKLTEIGVMKYNLGSVALDLAYVAAGKIDCLWSDTSERGAIAAGIVLVREAGGLCADFSGGAEHFKSGSIVAGNPKCLRDLCNLTRKFLV